MSVMTDTYDETELRPVRYPWVLVCHTCCAKAWTVNVPERWVPAVNSRKRHEDTCTGLLKPGA
jgi:hypothetical protein